MKVLIKDLTIHAVAEVNPMMQYEESIQLNNSLDTHGQFEPITIWRNKIIDGRNRVAQAKLLGWSSIEAVKLPHKTTSNQDLKDLVLIKETRRMQSKTQLAMKVAYELSKGILGTQAELAKANGVGLRLVKHAVYILKVDTLAAEAFFTYSCYSVSPEHTYYSLGKYVEELKNKKALQGGTETGTSNPNPDPTLDMIMKVIASQKLTADKKQELRLRISTL